MSNAPRLRRATADDLEWLRDLHRLAMRPHVEKAWGAWDEEAQRERFYASTDPATHDVVELDGTPIGCRWVRRHDDALELVRLYLLPEFQRRGIGAALVRQLLEEAGDAGLEVRLRVLEANPARRLYERLGFEVVGQTQTHLAMRHPA